MEKMIARKVSERDREYLRDESRMSGYAEEIAFPETEAEILQVTQETLGRKIPITVQGARTGITGAAVPQGGQILSLTNYNRILGLEQKGNTFFVRVQSGVSLEQLQKALRTNQWDTEGWDPESIQALAQLKSAPPQYFPPAPTEETATFGGMYSCNAAGITGEFHGKTSEFVERITLLLADGTVWEITRGEFVFDKKGCGLPDGRHLELEVTEKPGKFALLQPYVGMDLIDYLAGSEGMLGLILELTLRLVPEPNSNWGVMCFLKDAKDALSFAEALHTANKPITALEFFDKEALSFVQSLKKDATKLKEIPDIPKGAEAAVYFSLEAEDETQAEESLMDTLDLLARCRGEEEWTWAGSGRDEMEKFRLFRHAVPEAINRQIDANRLKCPEIMKLGMDCSAPDSYLQEMVRGYLREIRESGIQGTVFGHIPRCHLHVNLLPKNQEQNKKAAAMIGQWEERIREAGGNLATENGIGKIKKRIWKLLNDKERENISKAKAYFDPEGLWNPGNMMGN